jgi:hypothetical protein
MANQSIKDAFERMWQHTIAKLSTKADADHTHSSYVTSQDMSNFVGPLSMQLNTLQTKVDNGLATKTTLWEGAAPDMGYLIASDSLWNYDFTVFHLSVSGYAFDVIANTSCYSGLDSKTIILPYYVNTSNVSGITYLTVAIGQSGYTVQSSHWNGTVYNLTGIDGIKFG